MDGRRKRHEDSKEEILATAWGLAAERGLAGWTLRDLAERVGMRAPSLYVYFDSKNAVYDALFAQGNAELLRRVDAAPRAGRTEDRLRLAAQLFFDFCTEAPARHELLFLRTLPGFSPSVASYELATAGLDRLAGLLADVGLDRREDVDLWTAVVTGLATQQVSNDPGGDRWARLVDPVVDLFLARLRSRRRSRA